MANGTWKINEKADGSPIFIFSSNACYLNSVTQVNKAKIFRILVKMAHVAKCCKNIAQIMATFPQNNH